MVIDHKMAADWRAGGQAGGRTGRPPGEVEGRQGPAGKGWGERWARRVG